MYGLCGGGGWWGWGDGGYIDVDNTRDFKVCVWVVWWGWGDGGYIDVDNTRDFKVCVWACVYGGGGGGGEEGGVMDMKEFQPNMISTIESVFT